MLSACLVSLPAAPVIDPALPGGIGGTETRAWLFARALARRDDCRVQFVVRHSTPLVPDVRDGVSLRTFVDRRHQLDEQVGLCVERRVGFPWLRLKRWRWPLLWQAPRLALLRGFAGPPDWTRPHDFYQRIEADVFVTFGVQMNSARVIASAHASGRPAVLVIGSDGDLDETFLTHPQAVNSYGDRGATCAWILQQADAIVCQTESQLRRLRDIFGRDGTVVANPIDIAAWDIAADSPPAVVPEREFVLWVGRAEPHHKRPMRCVELARLCPDLRFLMILNPRLADEERRVREGAGTNVTILQTVPADRMPAVMSRAAALVNTSALEGFPNTFLQAGAAGKPVVSLEVGREYLEASGGGAFAAGNLELAAARLREYVQDLALRDETGARGRDWVRAHHSADAQAGRLLDVLRRASRNGPEQPAETSGVTPSAAGPGTSRTDQAPAV
ncbi:MAG: glycosyltransferase family 4 protein [Planctomyces sp.]|nr:glycosyltransferase family 4 protein [Planctomyces sp.]